MFSRKITYQVLIAFTGIIYMLYNHYLQPTVSAVVDSYIIFPTMLCLFLFFAYMYFKVEKR
ncbi:hypothetical protein CHN50_10005 [Priestia aryabhattai]|nr:hypothetical protein CHN50_10005 [Priestia aryabhattai]